MIQARVKTLPEDLRHANLCRLHPDTMDAIGVNPGELLLLEGPVSEGYRSEVLTRVWLRCPKIGVGTTNNEMPELEIDPGLMEYLNITDGDTVSLKTDFREEIVSAITFQTTRELSKEEETELRRLIQQAHWPVYHKAFFGVNLSGKPVELMVTSDCHPLSVIGSGTVISIHNQTTSQELRLRNDIMAVEMAINQVRKKKALFEFEIQNLDKEKQRISSEEKSYNETLGTLKSEIDRTKRSLNEIPRQTQKLKENFSNLDIENQKLHDAFRLLEIESEKLDGFNLNEREAKCKKWREEIEKGLSEIERQVQNVQQQLAKQA